MDNLIPISAVRANLPDLVKKVNEKLDRITITINGQPKAVIVSEEELSSLEETAEVLSITGAKKRILKGAKEIKKGKYVNLYDLK